MLEPALAEARCWGDRVRALSPGPGRPLGQDETVFLFRIHERLNRWLANLAATPPPPTRYTDEQLRSGLRYLELLRVTVRATLVRANTGLVLGAATSAWARAKAASAHLTVFGLEDLAQEGHIGLLRAVDRFDWRRGWRFSTYASVVIRRQIDRALLEKAPLVYLPPDALRSLRTVRDYSVTYREQHGRGPAPAEIARATGVPLDSIAAILSVGRLVAEREDDLAGAAWESVPDVQAVDALRALVSAEVERMVNAAVAALHPLEREVIARRFGLWGEPELSQAQVGRLIGYSQQRIAQLEAAALLKLLVAARRRGIDAKGDGTLDELLAVFREHGVGETEALPELSRWLDASHRMRDPRALRARLERLHRPGRRDR